MNLLAWPCHCCMAMSCHCCACSLDIQHPCAVNVPCNHLRRQPWRPYHMFGAILLSVDHCGFEIAACNSPAGQTCNSLSNLCHSQSYIL